MRAGSRRGSALLVVVLGLMGPGSVRADEAGDLAAARLLGGDGILLADAGNCQQAIEKLRRAEELHHAPTTAARLGECEIAVGRIVAGTERLQRLLREPVPANAPAPFVEASARARSALDHAFPRIATLRIDVKAPAGSRIHVLVDGEPLPDALLGGDRPTDPGLHTVEAHAAGTSSDTRSVTLADGESTNVALELSPVATPATAYPKRNSASTRSASTEPGARAHPGSISAGWAIAAFTVGGIGLATGITAGMEVAVKSADLSSSCSAARTCPLDRESEIASAKTWATVSTVGFAVAGTAVAAGLGLLLFTRHEPASSSDARIDPVVGPLYVGCAGAF